MRSMIVTLTFIGTILLTHAVGAQMSEVAVHAFGRMAANITACPVRSDYLRFYALLDNDTHAAFDFARDHKCIQLEGETQVSVDQIIGDTSCVRPSGAYNCVWTSSHRIKSLVDPDTKALIDDVNRVFDQMHPECQAKIKPQHCF